MLLFFHVADVVPVVVCVVVVCLIGAFNVVLVVTIFALFAVNAIVVDAVAAVAVVFIVDILICFLKGSSQLSSKPRHCGSYKRNRHKNINGECRLCVVVVYLMHRVE